MLNFFNEKFRLFLMIDLEYLMACLIWVRIFFFFCQISNSTKILFNILEFCLKFSKSYKHNFKKQILLVFVVFQKISLSSELLNFRYKIIFVIIRPGA
jgi:hypothetical protein